MFLCGLGCFERENFWKRNIDPRSSNSYDPHSMDCIVGAPKNAINLFLCFVDLTSLYNLVNKANLVHNFS